MMRSANAIHQPQDGLHWHWEDLLRAAKPDGMVKCLHTELFVDDSPRFLRTGGSADNFNWLGKLRELAPDLFIVIRLYHPAWWTLDPRQYAEHYHALLSRWRGHGYADRNVWQDPLIGIVPANEQNIERALGTGAACSWWNCPTPGATTADKVAWSVAEYKKIAAWNLAFWDRIDELEPNRKALAVWSALAQGHDCRPDAPESEYQIPEIVAAVRRCDVFNHHPYAHWNGAPPAPDGPGQKDEYWGLLRGHRPKGWRDVHQPGRPADPGGALAIFSDMPYIAGECGTFKHSDPAWAERNMGAIDALWRADAATGRCLGSAVYIWHGHDDHRDNVIMHSPQLRNALRDSVRRAADVAWPVAWPGRGIGGSAPRPVPSPGPSPVPAPQPPAVPAPPTATAVEARAMVLRGEGWTAIARRALGREPKVAEVRTLQEANGGGAVPPPGSWVRSPFHRVEKVR